MKYNKSIAIQKTPNLVFVVNGEGLGYCDSFKNMFITSAFDGCASVFLVRDMIEEEEDDDN
jgi:hypothetical protein